MRLTLFILRVVGVVGGAGVFACGQRAGEQHVAGGALVLRGGKGSISAPAA